MSVLKLSLRVALLIALAGCATRVPYEKSSYVGEWLGETAYLSIERKGYVIYDRSGRFSSTSLEGILKGFKGDNVQVGFGLLFSTVRVDKPPYLEDGEWKMIVDGRELVRIDD